MFFNLKRQDSYFPDVLLYLLFCFCLQVNLDDLFSPLRFRSVRRSGLTLLRQDDEPESAQQQQHVTNLRPMEISAFRVEID